MFFFSFFSVPAERPHIAPPNLLLAATNGMKISVSGSSAPTGAGQKLCEARGGLEIPRREEVWQGKFSRLRL